MLYSEELVRLIVNNENRNAIALLEKLRDNSFCTPYVLAREKLLITETARILNERLPLCYIDESNLIKDLFEDNMATEKAIEMLCMLVKKSNRADKQSAVEKSLSYIDKNIFSCQLTVGGAAEYSALTQSEFVKLFKESKGITPGDYIGKKRAKESISYLEKNFSVEKVACAVGFSSVETYIRTFKKHMGMTPGMWKKKYL